MSLGKEVFLFGFTVCLTLISELAAASFENRIDEKTLANVHSPILISRKDQISDPYTDRPLLLAYSVAKSEKELRIIYTMFFSDEDSVRKTSKKAKHMARFGRGLDVEWIYAVRIDASSGAVLERTYQCEQILGIGHGKCPFKGEFDPGTEHPILYTIARHNIFGDRPQFPYGSRNGYRTDLRPEVEIPYPKSRDMIPIEHPELLRASDEELAREGRLPHPSTEYLYLRIRGFLKGKIFPYIIDPIGLRFQTSTRSAGSLRDLGLDLWGKESVVAIWLPPATRRNVRIGAGEFKLGFVPLTHRPKLHLEDLGAYMIDQMQDSSYSSVDLSSRIRCTVPSDLSTCRL